MNCCPLVYGCGRPYYHPRKEDDNKTDWDHQNGMERRRISTERSTNGGSRRGANGRFAKGNPGGPGNPQIQRVQRLRITLLNAITPEDIQAIARRLIQQAKKGSVAAAKIIFERGMGAQALDFDLRLTDLENQVLEFLESQNKGSET